MISGFSFKWSSKFLAVSTRTLLSAEAASEASSARACGTAPASRHVAASSAFMDVGNFMFWLF